MKGHIKKLLVIIFALIAIMLLDGCAALKITKNPLVEMVPATEGAVFVSITHAGGIVNNWDSIVVEEVNGGKSGPEYILRAKRLREQSNTTLIVGSLKEGTYRIKQLSKFAVGEIRFDLGNDLQKFQFYVRANTVNDLGRLVVGGPFQDSTSIRQGFVMQVTKNFLSNKPYIQRQSAGYLSGKTIINSGWTGTETAHDFSDFGKIVANGYDALIADPTGAIFTGNRMGALLRVREDRVEGSAAISIFDTGVVDTIKTILLMGDEAVLGGDMPNIPVVELSTRKVSQLSTQGLATGSVEYLHVGTGDDLFAVICSREKLTLQHCPKKSNCEWNTIRTISRDTFLGEHPDDDLCGGGSFKQKIFIYVADEKGRQLVSNYDMSSGKWDDQVAPFKPANIAINYDERIVIMRDINKWILGQPFIMVSDDSGKSWQEIKYPTVAAPTSPPMFISKEEGYWIINNASVGELFSLSSKYTLMKTTDGGTSWFVLSDKMPNVYKLYPLVNKEKFYARMRQADGQSALISIDRSGNSMKLIDAKPKLKSVNGRAVE